MSFSSISSTTKSLYPKSIRIGLIDPNIAQTWAQRVLSDGTTVASIKKGDTINHTTSQPIATGLFCQRIFGPCIDYTCACGHEKIKIHRNVNVSPPVCPECHVEWTDSSVRRQRLGSIELISPVTHKWFSDSRNYIPILSGITVKTFKGLKECKLFFPFPFDSGEPQKAFYYEEPKLKSAPNPGEHLNIFPLLRSGRTNQILRFLGYQNTESESLPALSQNFLTRCTKGASAENFYTWINTLAILKKKSMRSNFYVNSAFYSKITNLSNSEDFSVDFVGSKKVGPLNESYKPISTVDSLVHKTTVKAAESTRSLTTSSQKDHNMHDGFVPNKNLSSHRLETRNYIPEPCIENAPVLWDQKKRLPVMPVLRFLPQPSTINTALYAPKKVTGLVIRSVQNLEVKRKTDFITQNALRNKKVSPFPDLSVKLKTTSARFKQRTQIKIAKYRFITTQKTTKPNLTFLEQNNLDKGLLKKSTNFVFQEKTKRLFEKNSGPSSILMPLNFEYIFSFSEKKNKIHSFKSLKKKERSQFLKNFKVVQKNIRFTEKLYLNKNHRAGFIALWPKKQNIVATFKSFYGEAFKWSKVVSNPRFLENVLDNKSYDFTLNPQKSPLNNQNWEFDCCLSILLVEKIKRIEYVLKTVKQNIDSSLTYKSFGELKKFPQRTGSLLYGYTPPVKPLVSKIPSCIALAPSVHSSKNSLVPMLSLDLLPTEINKSHSPVSSNFVFSRSLTFRDTNQKCDANSNQPSSLLNPQKINENSAFLTQKSLPSNTRFVTRPNDMILKAKDQNTFDSSKPKFLGSQFSNSFFVQSAVVNTITMLKAVKKTNLQLKATIQNQISILYGKSNENFKNFESAKNSMPLSLTRNKSRKALPYFTVQNLPIKNKDKLLPTAYTFGAMLLAKHKQTLQGDNFLYFRPSIFKVKEFSKSTKVDHNRGTMEMHSKRFVGLSNKSSKKLYKHHSFPIRPSFTQPEDYRRQFLKFLSSGHLVAQGDTPIVRYTAEKSTFYNPQTKKERPKEITQKDPTFKDDNRATFFNHTSAPFASNMHLHLSALPSVQAQGPSIEVYFSEAKSFAKEDRVKKILTQTGGGALQKFLEFTNLNHCVLLLQNDLFEIALRLDRSQSARRVLLQILNDTFNELKRTNRLLEKINLVSTEKGLIETNQSPLHSITLRSFDTTGITDDNEIYKKHNTYYKLKLEGLEKKAQDLKKEYKAVKKICTDFQNRKNVQKRRYKLAFQLLRTLSNPAGMTLSSIPVLPPGLRPIIDVPKIGPITADLNIRYRGLIFALRNLRELAYVDYRNTGAAQASVQEAVDDLLYTGGKTRKDKTVDRSPKLYKSLAMRLKGKHGRFRGNLLGKRVDYSGRSVIVVGPTLKIHQCGLPFEIATKLFNPFLIRRLIQKGLCKNVYKAKQILISGKFKPLIWTLCREVMLEHLVLLNRAPTLHRLGVQAFMPILISGRAILLHPLVCTGFNADFDGDQMGVHIPLFPKARAEAWKMMWSRNNFLAPSSGEPILLPSQDMVLGCYYLTEMCLGIKPPSFQNFYKNKKNALQLNKNIHTLTDFRSFSQINREASPIPHLSKGLVPITSTTIQDTYKDSASYGFFHEEQEECKTGTVYTNPWSYTCTYGINGALGSKDPSWAQSNCALLTQSLWARKTWPLQGQLFASPKEGRSTRVSTAHNQTIKGTFLATSKSFGSNGFSTKPRTLAWSLWRFRRQIKSVWAFSPSSDKIAGSFIHSMLKERHNPLKFFARALGQNGLPLIKIKANDSEDFKPKNYFFLTPNAPFTSCLYSTAQMYLHLDTRTSVEVQGQLNSVPQKKMDTFIAKPTWSHWGQIRENVFYDSKNSLFYENLLHVKAQRSHVFLEAYNRGILTLQSIVWVNSYNISDTYAFIQKESKKKNREIVNSVTEKLEGDGVSIPTLEIRVTPYGITHLLQTVGTKKSFFCNLTLVPLKKNLKTPFENASVRTTVGRLLFNNVLQKVDGSN